MLKRFFQSKHRISGWPVRVTAGLLVFALVGFSTYDASDPESDASRTDTPPSAEWGAEALAATHHIPIIDGLIRPANACGLGASSCFKCHNGRRAAAPGDDLWHRQHASVNHSCVGCHGGNPRLMREKMAHRGLRPDPRTTAQQSCASCHQGSDVSALLQLYMTTAN